jgi:hypothetical protein
VEAIPFEEFIGAIAPLQEAAVAEKADETAESIRRGVERLESLPAIDVKSLADLISEQPEWIRVLALAVGLSQEQLKNLLTYRFKTSSLAKAARSDPRGVVDALDALGLRDGIESGRRRHYSYADLLVERYASRARAGRAIGRGRLLEDAVQAVVEGLRLPYEMRGRFFGRGAKDAPCDLAIPAMGRDAEIVVAIKGFGSTGSKLTDAVREVEQMAQIRRPTQFVYAVFDGTGWLNRRNDLRQVHRLWEERQIDGLYALAHLPQFREDLAAAAPRVNVTKHSGAGETCLERRKHFLREFPHPSQFILRFRANKSAVSLVPIIILSGNCR